MPYLLQDVYVGNFPETQPFGANPQKYNALYGLKGHNGVDFGCPTGTMVLSAADGFVSELGFDEGGYGNYVKVVHNGFLTLYGHLNDYIVNLKDRVIAGQLLGHSNNTGNSTGPHLHFGVAPCDENGVKTSLNNGYSGYIDPMGSECEWHIKNLTAPIVPATSPITPEDTTIPVKTTDFTNMVAQGTDYKVIATFCQGNGLNDFLTANKQAPVDLNSNPSDPEGGNKINMFIADLMVQIKELKDNSPQITTTPPVQASASSPQATSLLTTIYNSIHDFIIQK